MASSDIFDVLNIKQRSRSPLDAATSSTASSTPTPASRNVNTTTGMGSSRPQMTGLQRELYSLLGENQPPIVLQQGSKFKEKLKSTAKPSPWTYAKFKANNNVELSHWVRGSKELIGDEIPVSTFAKYDVHLTVPEFTKEQYEDFMTSGDGLKKEQIWDYEEIKYLFQLCKKYDLKWFVIHDRYDYQNKDGDTPPLCLEDLKERFYHVSKRYFSKFKPDESLLAHLDFPKEKEMERKKYLQRLLSRSAAEIAEEEALIIESRKFEMAAKKTLNERESLLRLLDSPKSDQSVSQYLTFQGISQLYSSLLSDKSRKRKHTTAVPENPWMKQQLQFAQQKQQLQQLQNKQDSEGTSLSPRRNKKQKQEQLIANKRKSENVYAEHLLEGFNKDERNSLGVFIHADKLTPGAYLRSTKISAFKPALQNKVTTTLQELGLPTRPAMLTANVMEKHEELLKKITSLLDLKKHLDKLEAEKAITK